MHIQYSVEPRSRHARGGGHELNIGYTAFSFLELAYCFI